VHGLRSRLTVLTIALAGAMACGDHLLGVDEEFADEPETLPVCMLLSGTHGYWENGESNIVWDPERDHAGGVCMCMTEAEMVSGELDHELNDDMLVECERLSALLGYDWDECEEDYASGHWLGGTYRASADSFWHFLVPDDLHCE
jgi:hypothetical protein